MSWCWRMVCQLLVDVNRGFGWFKPLLTKTGQVFRFQGLGKGDSWAKYYNLDPQVQPISTRPLHRITFTLDKVYLPYALYPQTEKDFTYSGEPSHQFLLDSRETEDKGLTIESDMWDALLHAKYLYIHFPVNAQIIGHGRIFCCIKFWNKTKPFF